MEPMGKRLVSKGAYVKAQGQRLLLLWGGRLYCLMSALCLVLCLVLVLSGLLRTIAFHNSGQMYFFLMALMVSILGAVTFSRWGRDTCNQAVTIDPGVPFTRANAADLSVSDSLVRASSEPEQIQEAVLLRAALQSQETPPEQLVRASVGPE